MLRLVRSLLFITPAAAVILTFLAPPAGHALPLFARKYEMPCTQCHLAFPRLNAFGMQFRQNGYRVGDEKGQSPWESKEFPLSLVGNVGIQYLRGEEADTVFDCERLIEVVTDPLHQVLEPVRRDQLRNQFARELTLSARPLEEHHHDAREFQGEPSTQVFLDERQGQVHPRGDPG